MRQLQAEIAHFHEMGLSEIEWWDRDRVRAEVDSPLYLGAWHEPRCGLLDPAKQVRELKRLAEERGAVVYEETAVETVSRGSRFTLQTARGRVLADRVVFATNGWSNRFKQLRRRQLPVFTHVVVTEPLTPAQREATARAGILF